MHPGLDRHGHQRRGARDQPVDHGGRACRRGAEIHAGQHSDLESTEAGEHADAIAWLDLVYVECLLNGRDLRLEAHVIDARAPASDGAQPGGRSSAR